MVSWGRSNGGTAFDPCLDDTSDFVQAFSAELLAGIFHGVPYWIVEVDEIDGRDAASNEGEMVVDDGPAWFVVETVVEVAEFVGNVE